MLSVVLAVHNEEKNLARCLESVRSIVDELIIVDGESTDRTVEIAKSFGAQIITTTNKSNFHINKQMAMDAATGELVLQLDADEVLDEELISFVQKLKKQLDAGTLPAQPVAWYLRRRNYFLGRFLRKGGQYPDSVIRVYVAGKARLPHENVHEQMTVDGETATAEGHLLHYSFPDFQTYVHKFNRYSSFEAEHLQSQNIKPSEKMALEYWLFKPAKTFFLLFLRHRGYVDGFSGFAFALMSSIFHIFTYLKLEEYSRKAS